MTDDFEWRESVMARFEGLELGFGVLALAIIERGVATAAEIIEALDDQAKTVQQVNGRELTVHQVRRLRDGVARLAKGLEEPPGGPGPA